MSSSQGNQAISTARSRSSLPLAPLDAASLVTGVHLSATPGLAFSQVRTASCSLPEPDFWICASRLVSWSSLILKFLSQRPTSGLSAEKPLRARVWMPSPLPQRFLGSLSLVSSNWLYAQCGDQSGTTIGSFLAYERFSSASIEGVEPSTTLYSLSRP